jgi:DNA-binding response OmpR family regulator
MWISGVMQAGDLKSDLRRRVLRLAITKFIFPKEFDLLAFMMKNAGVLLTRAAAARLPFWGLEF